MEKFKIEYTGWQSQKEETGFDYVYFNAMIYASENNKDTFPASIPYRKIEKQVEETIDGGAAILQQIKKRIRGWGPQESLYTKELEQCGIDLGTISVKYIEKNYDLEAEAIRWSKNSDGSADLVEMTEDLENNLVDIKSESTQYFLICERLEKVISNEIIELFPVLLNSSSSNIIEFEKILVKHIPNLAEDLNNLVFNAGNNNDVK
jgi:hypothetical protein